MAKTTPAEASDACTAPPRDGIAGKAPHRLDRELALLAQDVYSGDDSRVEGWSALADADLRRLGVEPSLFLDEQSGFSARVYVHAEHGYVLAFRGTDELADWVTNLRQGLGLPAPQYEQAIEIAQDVHEALGDRLLAVTGHSLGAGLASITSLRTGVPAVTFNAAGVHDATLEHFGIPAVARVQAAETGLVRRYTVDNEILTQLQEDGFRTRMALPDGIGHRIRLPDPDPLSVLEHLAPARRLTHALHAHSMESVIAALDARGQPSDRTASAATLILQSLRGVQRLRDGSSLPALPGDGLLNTAVHLAARAAQSGMERIDHMVCSADGQKVLAIQGSPTDPAQRRVAVDIATAVAEPAHRNAADASQAIRSLHAPMPTPRVDLQQMHFVMSGH